MKADGFDWDKGNLVKCQKHGVSVEEIEDLFRSGPFVSPNFKHSEGEARFYAVGKTTAGRDILVSFTWREIGAERLVRPVSARYMHKREVKAYEKAIPTADQ